jgi:large subunit ribosomal protein L24
MNVRSGDLVEVIVGGVEARGKRGKVIVANPEKGTVIVEGLILVTKHKKPRSAQEQGGKIEMPRAINVSNVMLVCPKCGKKSFCIEIYRKEDKKNA